MKKLYLGHAFARSPADSLNVLNSHLLLNIFNSPTWELWTCFCMFMTEWKSPCCTVSYDDLTLCSLESTELWSYKAFWDYTDVAVHSLSEHVPNLEYMFPCDCRWWLGDCVCLCGTFQYYIWKNNITRGLPVLVSSGRFINETSLISSPPPSLLICAFYSF